jgi:hypothetical protein
MRVRGDRVQYLITGRISRSDFVSLGEEFQSKVSEMAMLEAVGARTTTYLSSTYAPIERREQLLPFTDTSAGVPTADELMAMLSEPEGARLEYKSSAWHHVAGSGDASKSTKKPTRKEMFGNISKGVVGMLNAFGGRVIVGIAEKSKVTIDDLRGAGYPDPKRVGDYIVIGIDPEYRDNWDEFKRRVMESSETA